MSVFTTKSVAALLGSAFVTAMAQVPATQAAENPFATTELQTGYKVAAKAEGKCGEGKAKKAEGKCGEGKCGEGKAKKSEGKCGEGKCGGKS